MRFVALAVILASLPAFIVFLQQNKARRDQALIALGLLCFAAGAVQVDAALITWPLWNGTVRGIVISPVDTLAIALIATRARHSLYKPFFALVGLFFLPILLSIALSDVPMASTFTFVQLLRMTLVFVAVSGELSRPGALRHFLIGISLGLMLQAGFVAQQKLTGVVQASGSMAHQNVLGLMVELSILPLIAAVLEGERNKVIYGGVAAGMIVIAGGGSRGAMAFVALGIVLLVIMSLARRMSSRKMKLVGIGVLASAIIVPLGLGTLNDRFGDTSFVAQEEQRAAFERSARAMASDHPFGVGANMFVSTNNLQGYADRAGVAWNRANRAAPVHNAYLLARAETGWLGQVCFVILLMAPMIIGLKTAFADRDSEIGGVALGSAVAILAVAIHNNFEYAWFVEQPQRLFFLNFAIIAAAAIVRKSDRAASVQIERNGSDNKILNTAGTTAKKPLVWRAGQKT